MRTRGFTLIELLIVVAIIAILAAIAVPNFLEAQTRAKVSKARADMRTLATCIELYRVDNNKYSTDAGDGQIGIYRPYGRGGSAKPRANFTIGFELTTPVAYISSAEMLIDPFKTNKVNYYKNASPQLSGREYYLYINVPLRKEKTPGSTYAGTFAAIGDWALWSGGPDGWGNNIPGSNWDFSDANYVPRRVEYDASNGTVSNGDIHRSQKYPDGVLQRSGV